MNTVLLVGILLFPGRLFADSSCVHRCWLLHRTGFLIPDRVSEVFNTGQMPCRVQRAVVASFNASAANTVPATQFMMRPAFSD